MALALQSMWKPFLKGGCDEAEYDSKNQIEPTCTHKISSENF
jgi:hypothetical protein